MEKALQKRKSKKSRKEKKGQSAASRRAAEPPQQRLSRGASRCGATVAAAPATAASKTLLSAATKVAAATRLLAAVKPPVEPKNIPPPTRPPTNPNTGRSLPGGGGCGARTGRRAKSNMWQGAPGAEAVEDGLGGSMVRTAPPPQTLKLPRPKSFAGAERSDRAESGGWMGGRDLSSLSLSNYLSSVSPRLHFSYLLAPSLAADDGHWHG